MEVIVSFYQTLSYKIVFGVFEEHLIYRFLNAAPIAQDLTKLASLTQANKEGKRIKKKERLKV